MDNTLSSELFWLAMSTLLTALMVAPYAIYRTRKLGGLWQVFLTPLPGDNPFDDEWAHRAYRAHMNAFEGLILFAPAVLAVVVSGLTSETTAIASAVYFGARLLYAPFYYFEVPILRTAIWMVGLGATLYLAIIVMLAGL